MTPPAPAPEDLLFVYGTLRSDAGHPMGETLAACARPWGPACVEGTLLRIDGYPGLVLRPGPVPVVGELWQVETPSAWPVLDRYEGCSPECPRPHEYARRTVPVQSTARGPRTAWTYVYIGATGGLCVIATGDWLDVARTLA